MEGPVLLTQVKTAILNCFKMFSMNYILFLNGTFLKKLISLGSKCYGKSIFHTVLMCLNIFYQSNSLSVTLNVTPPVNSL